MKLTRFLPVMGVVLLGLAACKQGAGGGGATATSAAPASPPVASVNGKDISKDFYEFYVKGVAGKAATELTAEQRNQLLDNLVRAQVVAQQATKDGIDKDTETATILELSRLNVLQQAVSQKYLKDKKPTDQELRTEYESQVAAMPKTEFHAQHILVATEAAAKAILEKLKKGGNFSEIAKKESLDSSKTNGGDLGWFTPDRMVKPFSDAVLALKKGESTQAPVQTQYGFHIIKLIDTREVTPPPFDTVKDRLGQIVMAKKFKAYEDDLIKTAKIEKKL
jgi:peptidyl-prolyl cis-trans isomerase C